MTKVAYISRCFTCRKRKIRVSLLESWTFYSNYQGLMYSVWWEGACLWPMPEVIPTMPWATIQVSICQRPWFPDSTNWGSVPYPNPWSRCTCSRVEILDSYDWLNLDWESDYIACSSNTLRSGRGETTDSDHHWHWWLRPLLFREILRNILKIDWIAGSGEINSTASTLKTSYYNRHSKGRFSTLWEDRVVFTAFDRS